MRLTQGTFSFLPDLTDEQIEAQITYALSNGWSIMVEYTDDPHPRNGLWDMWSPPMFDLEEDEADVVMRDVRACREAHSHLYVKVVAYDRSKGRQTSALSFIVNRPGARARLPPGAPGDARPRHPLHDPLLRRPQHAGGRALRRTGRGPRAGHRPRWQVERQVRRLSGTDDRNPA